MGSATAFYLGMVWLGGHFHPDFCHSLTVWLQGKREKNWTQLFCNLFDTLFGAHHISLKRFRRSAFASVLAVLILYVLLAHVLGVLGTRTFGRLDLWQAVGTLVMVNIVADYISLIETRWLLGRFQRVRSVAGQAVLLLADLIFTGAIIFLLLAAYSYLVTGEVPPPIEVLALFSVYSIYFYSTFLTSVWAWLYCVSSWFVRLYTQAKLNRILDVAKPVQQIALVGAGLILLGSLALGPLLRTEEGEIGNVIDRWLCDRDLSSCFLAARASGELEPTVLFMQMACRNEQDEGSCAERLDRFFGDDSATINTLWGRACEGGYARACRAYGYSHHHGRGIPQNFERAVDLYRRACESSDLDACFNLGLMYRDGLGVPVNAERAVALYRQACEGGNAAGCGHLGIMYEDGIGVSADAERAVALYRQACEGGNTAGCAYLGTMYEDGLGVSADAERAVALYRQACEGGNTAGCAYLGYMYKNGRGVLADAERAVALYRQACEGGNAAGCTNLGYMYAEGEGVPADAEQAVVFYKQGCEGGDVWSCARLGYMYAKGEGVPADAERAVALYRQACEGGNAAGCTNLGYMYAEGEGVPADAEQAVVFYSQGCESGSATSCANLGIKYEYGEGVTPDAERAVALYRQACAGSDASGCAYLGDMYEHGRGVPVDADQARAFYRKACDGGNASGCSKLELEETE
ncbi:MAG: hypothetical protein FJX25_03995 [Alphaproteobacteria bacterium]|nr:hypothetical protein [Alphaproteobacteria bacterium]